VKKFLTLFFPSLIFCFLTKIGFEKKKTDLKEGKNKSVETVPKTSFLGKRKKFI